MLADVTPPPRRALGARLERSAVGSPSSRPSSSPTAAPASQQPEKLSAIGPGWNDAESQFEIPYVVSFAAGRARAAAGFTLKTIVLVDDREGEPVARLGPVVSAVRGDDGVRTDRGVLLDPWSSAGNREQHGWSRRDRVDPSAWVDRRDAVSDDHTVVVDLDSLVAGYARGPTDADFGETSTATGGASRAAAAGRRDRPRPAPLRRPVTPASARSAAWDELVHPDRPLAPVTGRGTGPASRART